MMWLEKSKLVLQEARLAYYMIFGFMTVVILHLGFGKIKRQE